MFENGNRIYLAKNVIDRNQRAETPDLDGRSEVMDRPIVGICEPDHPEGF